jgi:hypothetical protein
VQWVGKRENMEKTRFPSSGGLGSQCGSDRDWDQVVELFVN